MKRSNSSPEITASSANSAPSNSSPNAHYLKVIKDAIVRKDWDLLKDSDNVPQHLLAKIANESIPRNYKLLNLFWDQRLITFEDIRENIYESLDNHVYKDQIELAIFLFQTFHTQLKEWAQTNDYVDELLINTATYLIQNSYFFNIDSHLVLKVLNKDLDYTYTIAAMRWYMATDTNYEVIKNEILSRIIHVNTDDHVETLIDFLSTCSLDSIAETLIYKRYSGNSDTKKSMIRHLLDDALEEDNLPIPTLRKINQAIVFIEVGNSDMLNIALDSHYSSIVKLEGINGIRENARQPLKEFDERLPLICQPFKETHQFLQSQVLKNELSSAHNFMTNSNSTITTFCQNYPQPHVTNFHEAASRAQHAFTFIEHALSLSCFLSTLKNTPNATQRTLIKLQRMGSKLELIYLDTQKTMDPSSPYKSFEEMIKSNLDLCIQMVQLFVSDQAFTNACGAIDPKSSLKDNQKILFISAENIDDKMTKFIDKLHSIKELHSWNNTITKITAQLEPRPSMIAEIRSYWQEQLNKENATLAKDHPPML